MVNDVVESILEKVSKSMNEDEKQNIINQTISQDEENLMVTPKEIDSLIDKVSKVIANGLNLALHDGITLDYVNRYM